VADAVAKMLNRLRSNKRAVDLALFLWRLRNEPNPVFERLNYWLFFRRHMKFIGKASARVNPSTRMLMRNSRVVVENGMLSLGYLPDWFPPLGSKDFCQLRLHNSTLRAVGNVDLRPGVRIWGINAKLVIGNGTVINGPMGIVSKVGVSIGADCQIAANTTIKDCDMHKHGSAGEEPKDDGEEVIIKDHCWIGENVTILKGVTVGEGAIIAAMSLVTKDVEARSMVGGVPARKIKGNIIWEA
jgi:acetyltransferase-like isoleucine patch superfamily enzyme